MNQISIHIHDPKTNKSHELCIQSTVFTKELIFIYVSTNFSSWQFDDQKLNEFFKDFSENEPIPIERLHKFLPLKLIIKAQDPQDIAFPDTNKDILTDVYDVSHNLNDFAEILNDLDEDHIGPQSVIPEVQNHQLPETECSLCHKTKQSMINQNNKWEKKQKKQAADYEKKISDLQSQVTSLQTELRKYQDQQEPRYPEPVVQTPVREPAPQPKPQVDSDAPPKTNACTFNISGPHPFPQEAFYCLTCSAVFREHVYCCTSCQYHCHSKKGHKLAHVGTTDQYFCNCRHVTYRPCACK